MNINAGHNRELLETCRTLGEYAEYVRRVREYTGEMSIEDAVEHAIRECIAEDILREFLEQNRAEAKAMSIYEYNNIMKKSTYEWNGKTLLRMDGKQDMTRVSSRNG